LGLNIFEHKEILQVDTSQKSYRQRRGSGAYFSRLVLVPHWNIGRMNIRNQSRDKISEQSETRTVLFENRRFSHAKVKHCNDGNSQGRTEAPELLVAGDSRCLAKFNKFAV